jgi:hypothetical protein
MKRTLRLQALAILVIALPLLAQDTNANKNQEMTGGKEVRVSLIDLIARPDDYDGKTVAVLGYLHNRFEDFALYFSKDDADYLIREKAIWVNSPSNVQLFDEESPNIRPKDISFCDCKYVVVRGRFNKHRVLRYGTFAGSIGEVSSISVLVRYFDGGMEFVR